MPYDDSGTTSVERRTSEVPRPGAVRRFVDRRFPWISAIPAFATVIALTLYPTVLLVRSAFFEDGRWVWSERIAEMSLDPVVGPATRNTLLFVVVVVTAETLFALLLALAASGIRRGQSIYRTSLLLPLLVPGVVIGTMWRLMLDYNVGIVNQVIAGIGLVVPAWLSDPDLALVSVMLVEVWHSTSFLFLLFLAAIATVPKSIIEAAEIDGANLRQLVRHMVLPWIRPVLLVAVILRIIDAFKLFDVLVVLTGGGPGTATEMLNLHVFETFFGQFRFGYGSFLGVLLAILIGVMAGCYALVSRRAGSSDR